LGTVYANEGKAAGTYVRSSTSSTTWSKQDPNFVAVTSISGVPTSGTAGEALALSGTVSPESATNKTIVWSVKNAGGTDAAISGNTLTTMAAGTVTVTAAIVNGQTASSNYTQDFAITIGSTHPYFKFGSGRIISYTGNAKDVVIPPTIDGQAVITIGDMAFKNNQLTSVTIPDSVTTIGEEAFRNNQLTSVTIPGSVTSIGSSAFWNNQLTSVTIGANVTITSIPSSPTFLGDLGIVDGGGGSQAGTYESDGNGHWGTKTPDGNFLYSISDGNVTIRGYTGSAASVLIPTQIDSLPVTTINGGAFYGNQLTSVTIPNSVTEIGDGAFLYTQLTSVTIGAGVTIGTYAFPGNFVTVYDNRGKAAGTYKSSNGGTSWTKQ
jgi:hypothetical protein